MQGSHSPMRWEVLCSMPCSVQVFGVLGSRRMRLVTFVSHQWVGKDHPDPDGQQTGVFRAFLLNLAAKRVILGSDFDALICLGA